MSGLSSGASVVARNGVDGDGTEGRRPVERHQERLPSIGDDLDIFLLLLFLHKYTGRYTQGLFAQIIKKYKHLE